MEEPQEVEQALAKERYTGPLLVGLRVLHPSGSKRLAPAEKWQEQGQLWMSFRECRMRTLQTLGR